MNHKQMTHNTRMERHYRALLDFLPDPVFVFDRDNTVVYLNPAFEKVFGWILEETAGRKIPFVPEWLKQETRQGLRRLAREQIIHDVETRRMTRDGRILDIRLDVAVFYHQGKDRPAGHVAILRDITREKQAARVNNALFRIARALYQFRSLDDRLRFIVNEVQELLGVRGATVILLDEEKKEFFFRVANYDNSETVRKKMKEIRYPADQGVAGYVYKTGKPMIVPDTYKCKYFLPQVDRKIGYHTRNMLDVPIRTPERMIGVLCAVNKKEGEFSQADADLLSTIASTVAFPIENARINEALQKSYEDVRRMSQTKERVIHHLSHELKTPVSVLAASLSLLSKKFSNSAPDTEDRRVRKILDRAQRNLNRILEMQYKIEDILKNKTYEAFHMLSALLDACTDELETLITDEGGSDDLIDRVRKRIEDLFGHREVVSENIQLDQFIQEMLPSLTSAFAHRRCQVVPRISEVSPILIPLSVLSKIVEGLIRNAVENTPDAGSIEVIVRPVQTGAELVIRDAGTGITENNQKLIFENNVSTRDTMQYSSRNPYDFNAGGKGFDLLRMKIFSEQYDFTIEMNSTRCRFIPTDADICPGDIDICPYCQQMEDCLDSGGTMVAVRFKAYAQNCSQK